MILCPYCGAENLEGVDQCEECQHSLIDISLPEPKTAVEKGLLKDRIDLMNPRIPLAVTPETPIGEVLEKMVAEAIGCVMILEDNKLCGIFTEFDALMKVNTNVAQMAHQPISSVMTTEPITLEKRNRIAYAVHKMHVGGYRHLPILQDGELVGLISIRDILNYLASRIAVTTP
jgi:CBS domain-containing protein